MDNFSIILKDAAALIGNDYFYLPVHDSPPVYRERVYCYELYHQMRLLWPKDSHFRLNGEVDKRNHPYFTNDGTEPKPDFIIHVPGHSDDNYAVIEVKHASRAINNNQKDFDTLTLFVNHCDYKRAIYFIYGDLSDEHADRLFEKASAIKNCELWLHPSANKECFHYTK